MGKNYSTKHVSKELQLLTKDSRAGLTAIYKKYREGFLAYCTKYQCPRELHLEAYHDAVLVFYDLFKEGKYNPETAGVKTLIYAIGKKQLLQKIRKEKRFKTLVKELEKEVNLSQVPGQKVIWNEQDNRMEKAMAKMSESCREILVLFYYHRYSIEAIQRDMGHANENVTKAHKSRCLKKLKKIFKTMNG